MKLPTSEDAELAVLACCLLHPTEAMPRVMAALGKMPDAFYVPQHQSIYTRMLDQYYVEGTFDLVTLNASIASEVPGGVATLAAIAADAPTLGMLGQYLSILAEQNTKRELVLKLEAATALAYDPQTKARDLAAIIDEITAGIRKESGDLRPVHESLQATMDEIESAFASAQDGNPFVGLSTGFRDMDAIFNGLRGNALHIFAGRPGSGKTAIKMQMAQDIAYRQGKNVAVFSLEMSTMELLRRMLSSMGGINQSAMSTGTLSRIDFIRLSETAHKIKEAGSMWVDPTPAVTIGEIRSRARRLNNKHGVDAIIVDYLQLVKSNTNQAKFSRVAELADISGGLKAMAKELDVPVIAGAQLNRDVESRAGGKPRMSDLRESGSLEQDADSVNMIYRSDEDAENVTRVNVAKYRNGQPGEILLEFEPHLTRFADHQSEGF